MANTYLELKRDQQNEINNFPMQFAFSDEQFKEGMEKLGLTENDTDKVYSIGGGGFIRKTDSKKLNDLIEKHEKEMQHAIDNDTNGEGFVYEMFSYELSNHEYCITRDVMPTLEALGLTYEEVKKDEKLYKALNKARLEQ